MYHPTSRHITCELRNTQYKMNILQEPDEEEQTPVRPAQ